MDTLDDLNAHRQDIAKTYEEAFDDEGVIPIPEVQVQSIRDFP